MTTSQKTTKSSISAIDAIIHRRAVRDYAPQKIIVGLPAGETPPVPRKPPEILSWK